MGLSFYYSHEFNDWTSTKSYILTLGGKYYFTLYSGIRLYTGLGLGVGFWNSKDDYHYYSYKSKGTEFVYNGLIGLSFPLSNRFSLLIESKVFGSSDFSSVGFIFLGGLMFHF